MKKILLISGTRDNQEASVVLSHIHDVIKEFEPDLVIHGGCTGVDAAGDLIAKSLGIHVANVEALWNIDKHHAGSTRNIVLVDLGVILKLGGANVEYRAWPGIKSIGTWHFAKHAKDANLVGVVYDQLIKAKNDKDH